MWLHYSRVLNVDQPYKNPIAINTQNILSLQTGTTTGDKLPSLHEYHFTPNYIISYNLIHVSIGAVVLQVLLQTTLTLLVLHGISGNFDVIKFGELSLSKKF